MAPELAGTSDTGTAVSGTSQKGEGVRGTSVQGPGVVGQGSPAGRFEGDLEVAGIVTTTHVNARGNLNCDADLNGGGSLAVKGTVFTTNVEASGNVDAAGDFNAGGGLAVKGTVFTTNVEATGNVDIEGDFNAGGSLKVEDTVFTTHVEASGNVDAAGDFNAGGGLAVKGTVFTKHVSAEGNVSARGNVNAHNLNVVGDIRLENADCAEEFDVEAACAPAVGPGTVMVLGDDGSLRHSTSAYDKRVAGVVSGAGGYRPGIVFDRKEPRPDRVPVAMLGKVFCNVDAGYGAVEVGDLLTTSDTPGHAMTASDPSRAFGAVIGKALRPLHDGRALVPILVALQ